MAKTKPSVLDAPKELLICQASPSEMYLHLCRDVQPSISHAWRCSLGAQLNLMGT